MAFGNQAADGSLRVVLTDGAGTDQTGGLVVDLGANNDVTVTGDVTTVPGVSANLSRVAVNISSAATTSLVAAVADQETRVYKVFLTIGGANNLTWKSANDALGGVLQFTGPGSFVLDFDGEPWLVTATNEALQLTTSTAAQVSGFVYYITS